MPVQPKDDAFLSRWSRRKRADAETETVEEAADELDAAVVESDEEISDEELLEKLELPDPDGMARGDDFSAFMRAGVPERLRRRALRSLWVSNPALANLDELLDYGEDFTDAATVIENMQTVYEVGKGAAEKWKRHLAALAAEEEGAERKAVEQGLHMPDAPAPEVLPDEEVEEAVLAVEEAPEPAEPPPVSAPPAATAPPPLAPPPRHMRFAFD